MTRAVLKFAVPEHGHDQRILMPCGAKPLRVEFHNGRAHIFALIDPAAPCEYRTFKIVGTGWPIEVDLFSDVRVENFYVGSWQEGTHLWHLFEIGGAK